VAYSISIFSKDRNFSPPPDLLSHQTFYAVSVYQGGIQREREADHAVVVGGDIESDWSYIHISSHISRAFSLIKCKNSTEFVFTFLILSCHV
jgi:hypothetical protein